MSELWAVFTVYPHNEWADGPDYAYVECHDGFLHQLLALSDMVKDINVLDSQVISITSINHDIMVSQPKHFNIRECIFGENVDKKELAEHLESGLDDLMGSFVIQSATIDVGTDTFSFEINSKGHTWSRGGISIKQLLQDCGYEEDTS